MNVFERCTAEADGCRNIGKPAVHQHDVGCINSDIRSGADGDADVRTGERRCVVDAVADHGNFAFFLQLADDGFFSVRQYAGDNLVYACLSADRACCARIVAGEHHDVNPHVLQRADGLGAVLLNDVCNGDHAQQHFVSGEEERRLALLCELLCALAR